MGECRVAGNVTTNVHRIQQLLLRLVQVPGADVEVRRWKCAVVSRLEDFVRLGHRLRNVLGSEVDVEGGIGAHQVTAGQTLSQIPDRVQSGLEVRAGRVHGNAHRGVPALQQRHQVVQERVVRVRGVGDRLMALDVAMLRPHVVLQHPEVAALQGLLVVVVVEAVDQRSHTLLQLLLIACDYVAAVRLAIVHLGDTAGPNVSYHLGGIAQSSRPGTTIVRQLRGSSTAISHLSRCCWRICVGIDQLLFLGLEDLGHLLKRKRGVSSKVRLSII